MPHLFENLTFPFTGPFPVEYKNFLKNFYNILEWCFLLFFTESESLHSGSPGCSDSLSPDAPVLPTLANAVTIPPKLTLDDEVLNVLGPRLLVEKVFTPPVPQDFALRWEEIVQLGLKQEERDALLIKYPLIENCEFLEPPSLNSELLQALTDVARTRDQRLVKKQARLAACLTGIGKSVSALVTTDGPKNLMLIETLSDVGRLLADLFYEENAIRRSLVLAHVNVEIKDTLNSSPADKLLFGSTLVDNLKSAKLVAQSAAVLKIVKQPFKPLDQRCFDSQRN